MCELISTDPRTFHDSVFVPEYPLAHCSNHTENQIDIYVSGLIIDIAIFKSFNLFL